jgi:hypothetical protein
MTTTLPPWPGKPKARVEITWSEALKQFDITSSDLVRHRDALAPVARSGRVFYARTALERLFHPRFKGSRFDPPASFRPQP